MTTLEQAQDLIDYCNNTISCHLCKRKDALLVCDEMYKDYEFFEMLGEFTAEEVEPYLTGEAYINRYERNRDVNKVSIEVENAINAIKRYCKSVKKCDHCNIQDWCDHERQNELPENWNNRYPNEE